jgi:AsmA protein
MVLGTLASKVSGQGLSASGLGNLLLSELPSLRSFLPAGLSIPGLSATASNVTSRVSDAAAHVRSEVPSMRRKVLITIGAIVALLLIVILILPSLIDANRFKPEIQTQLGTALGRNVQIGNIKLSIFSGGVVVNDVAISDDPAFSRSQFLTARELTVGVHLIPLIFSKRVEVESITAKQPQVTLLRNSAGLWNYSSMGGGTSKTAAKSSSSSPNANSLSVGKIEITNGKISVANVGSKAKPLIYQDVNLTVTDLSSTSQFPFKLSAKDPGNGALKVEGKAGPINQEDASLTPMDATIDLQHLDLATFGGFTSPNSGIAGLVDFNGSVVSDGQKMSSKGKVTTTKLKLSAAGSPSTVPVDVDYNVVYQLKPDTGTLQQGDIHVGKALAKLTGGFNISGETASVQMKLNGQGMSVPDLEGVLPAVGVTLPSGAALKTGTLDANLAINGPVDKLVITGPVHLANGTITGFSVGQKLGALGTFAGLGGGSKSSDTVIESMNTNVRVEPAGTHAQDLNVVIQGIGSITGDANVDAAGKLDCKMVAHLSGGALGGVSQVASVASLPLGGGGKGDSGGGGGIPFRITGTTSNPVFIPDVAGVAGGVAKGGAAAALGGGKAMGGAAGGAAGAVGGLLGKHK